MFAQSTMQELPDNMDMSEIPKSVSFSQGNTKLQLEVSKTLYWFGKNEDRSGVHDDMFVELPVFADQEGFLAKSKGTTVEVVVCCDDYMYKFNAVIVGWELIPSFVAENTLKVFFKLSGGVKKVDKC